MFQDINLSEYSEISALSIQIHLHKLLFPLIKTTSLSKLWPDLLQ